MSKGSLSQRIGPTCAPARGSLKIVVQILLVAVWGAAAAMSFFSIPSAGIGWDVLGDTSEEYYSAAAFGAADLDAAIEKSACEDLACSYRGLLVQQVGRLSYELATGTAMEAHSPYAIGSIRFQQVFTALLFQCALIAGSVAVSARTRSTVTGLFFGAFAASVPLLSGHASMNHKDSPVASGFLLIASAILIRSTTRGRLALVSSHILLAGGIFVVLGQRPSAMLLVLGLAGLDLLAQLFRAKRWRPRDFLARSAFWGAGLTVGGLFLVLTNPFARVGGLSWLVGAALHQSDYPWGGEIRFGGNDYEAGNLPVWYIPANFWLQLPTLTTIFLVLSGIFGLWSLRKRRLRRLAADPVMAILAFSLIVPAGIAFIQATMYDSVRHVLFLLPLWLLVAVSFTAGRANRAWLSSKPLARLGVAAIPVAVLVFNVFSTAQWFPYQYAYINEFAAQSGDYSWETDYWGLSAKEGVETLLDQGAKQVVVRPTSGTSWWVGGRKFTHPDVEALSEGDPLGIWIFARFDASLAPFDCETAVEIRRGGVLLGSGGICDYDANFAKLP